jgi:hypothetical protein
LDSLMVAYNINKYSDNEKYAFDWGKK